MKFQFTEIGMAHLEVAASWVHPGRTRSSIPPRMNISWPGAVIFWMKMTVRLVPAGGVHPPGEVVVVGPPLDGVAEQIYEN